MKMNLQNVPNHKCDAVLKQERIINGYKVCLNFREKPNDQVLPQIKRILIASYSQTAVAAR